MPTFTLALCSVLALMHCALGKDPAKHLFILSGQSNMQGHRPEEAFIPTVEKAFGKSKVIVVQDALGGQPIHRWWKQWKDPAGERPEQMGDLYDRLMDKVQPAIQGQELASVSFVWMQGERDARMGWGKLYEKALLGLHAQVAEGISWDAKKMNFVIGRLSDFDMSDKTYPHWTLVRKVQVKVADSNDRFAWVDTDDLNDGKNRKGREIKDDLHYSAKGYVTLGRRFAEACIGKIRGSGK